MAGLSAGLSTFASCNKAGSIPHFTAHLRTHPRDYTALMWRGRAYSIIGQSDDAVADFVLAGICSYGAKRNLAEAMRAHVEGRPTERMNILQSTVKRYPECAEAWSELGSANFQRQKYNDALQQLCKAISLANSHKEFHEPWVSWTNHYIGEVYFYQKNDLGKAKQYYKTAVESCDSLTIAHLGISRCNVLQSNRLEARNEYEKAKRLNPKLVHWQTFNEFEEYAIKSMNEAQFLRSFIDVLSQLNEKGKREETQSSYAGVGKGVSEWSVDRSVSDLHETYNKSERYTYGLSSPRVGSGQPWYRTSLENARAGDNKMGTRYNLMGLASGGNHRGGSGTFGGNDRGRGGTGGGNGGGNGNGGGGNSSRIYERIKEESRTIKKSDSGTYYVKVGKSDFWLSRDKAGHGGSFCKVYEQGGNTLFLKGSVPINIFKDHVLQNDRLLQRMIRSGPILDDFDIMLNKHESQKDRTVSLNSLNGVR